MRRSAFLLAVALTVLLVSSAFWRPLRPGPAPGPEAGPLAFLSYNLGLRTDELPRHDLYILPAHELAVSRLAQAQGKTDQLAVEKSVQPPLREVALLDSRKAARRVRGGQKALHPYPVPKPHPTCCPACPSRPRKAHDSEPPLAWLVVMATADTVGSVF